MNYEVLDFPAIPEKLILDCKQRIQETTPVYKLSFGDEGFAGSEWDVGPTEYPNGHLGFNTTKEIYEYVKNRPGTFVKFSIYKTPNSVKEWVNDNIQPLISNKFKINNIELFVISEGDIGYPHIDPPHSVFNYMIEVSSDKVLTQFWKPKEEFKDLPIYPVNVYPYEKLDFVEEINIKKNSWVWLNVQELHSIEHLDPASPRIILQVDVSPV